MIALLRDLKVNKPASSILTKKAQLFIVSKGMDNFAMSLNPISTAGDISDYNQKLTEIKSYIEWLTKRDEQYYSIDDALASRIIDDESYGHRRLLMVDWCYRVVDHFLLPRYLVEWTMIIVDRFFVKNPKCVTDPDHLIYTDPDHLMYKNFVAASFRLVVKLDWGETRLKVSHNPEEGKFSTILHLNFLQALPLIYSPQDLKKMKKRRSDMEDVLDKFEMAVLRYFKFDVYPTLSVAYVDEYWELLQLQSKGFAAVLKGEHSLSTGNYVKKRDAECMVQLSVSEAKLVSAGRSNIALASILNAVKLYYMREWEKIRNSAFKGNISSRNSRMKADIIISVTTLFTRGNVQENESHIKRLNINELKDIQKTLMESYQLSLNIQEDDTLELEDEYYVLLPSNENYGLSPINEDYVLLPRKLDNLHF